MHGTGLESAARRAAEQYVSEGWKIVPVPHGAKAPTDVGWPEKTYEPADIDGNVGVVLGPVSGGLVDVDLDSHWALALAPHFLPESATFGRVSKPRSHWLYYCPGLRSQRFQFARDGKVELVELRAQNASSDRCGHQSVFPGSVHASGELIEWTPDGADTIAKVERGALIWATARLAVACVIADGWEAGSQRNAKARAWAAGLLHSKWTPDEVLHLFEAVFDVAGVEEPQRSNDLGGVERTIQAFADGTKLQGYGTLVGEGLVPAETVRRVEKLARTPDTLAAEQKLAKSQMGAELRNQLIRETQNTDALSSIQDERALLLESPKGGALGSAGDDFFGRSVSITTPAEPIKYTVPGLSIAPGKVTGLIGFSGTSKGPFMNQLALCIASGKPFLGKPVERRKVAYFDFETGRLFDDRIWRLNNALGIDRAELEKGEWFTAYHSERYIDEEWLLRFEAALEPGMVVFIDSYGSAVLGDENSSEYAMVAWQLGKISVAKDCSIIIVFHSKKKGQGRSGTSLLEQVSGHNALTRAMQTAILLYRKDEDDPSTVSVRCGRAPSDPFKGFDMEWVDVEDPSIDITQSPGARLKGAKWGLLAKRVGGDEKKPKVPKGELNWDETVKEVELELLQRMQREFPNGLQVSLRELVRGVSSGKRPAAAVATRQLVQRGALLANFHWRDAPKVRQPMNVWAPGNGAEAGVAQL